MPKTLPPIHPGEILREEFMAPMGISINALARELHVSLNRVSEIVNAKRGVTAGTALRLAAFFGTTPQFWMNLQNLYDLEVANAAEAKLIRQQIHPFAPAHKLQS